MGKHGVMPVNCWEWWAYGFVSTELLFDAQRDEIVWAPGEKRSEEFCPLHVRKAVQRRKQEPHLRKPQWGRKSCPALFRKRRREDFGKGIKVGQMPQRTFLRSLKGEELHLTAEELT